MPQKPIEDQTSIILRGMTQTFGEHSRLVGQSIEVLASLTDRVLDLPTRKQFVLLAIVGGGGILLSTILSAAALIVVLAS